MSFGRIVGQSRAIKVLKSGLLSGRIPAAYFFVGPPGVGKVLTAIELVKALNCQQGSGDSCDRCNHCHLIDKGEFPDFFVPAKHNRKITKSACGPEQDKLFLADIVSRLHYPPVMGRYKTILLEPAEALTAEAGSMLLKIMEEPPSNTLFLLVSSVESAVMPTLASRCQKVRFTPLAASDVAGFLIKERGVEEHLAAALAAAAQGSIERAEELRSKGALDSKLEIVDFLLSLFEASLSERVSRAERMLKSAGTSEREAAERIGTILSMLARDLINASCGMGKESLLFFEAESRINQMCTRIGRRGVLAFSSVAAEFNRGLARNQNPRSLLHYLCSASARIWLASQDVG